MDQDSFRRLLQTPHTASTSSPGFTKPKAKAKAIDASQPAFKPRKVKKPEGQYRDRAAERRDGQEGDYAQVEAVLEDFQKRSAGQDKSTLDAQRHYLGGDATHTVLVKGLDMALLEQNRARAALGADAMADDDSLEQAFAESQAQPKKRTREELIRALKERRAGQTARPVQEDGDEAKEKKAKAREGALVLEEAKLAGKFRPIGFTPIGEAKKKKKATNGEVDGEKRKKKKRKVDNTESVPSETPGTISTQPEKALTAEPAPTVPPPSLPQPAPEPALPEDFDIFVDAGEYEGIQLDSDSEGEVDEEPPSKLRESEPEPGLDNVPRRRWIDTGSPEPESEPSKPELLKSVLAASSSSKVISSRPEEEKEDGEEEDEERAMRLVPLASSALPSIKDFLAAEGAASGSGKRRKRKGGAGAGRERNDGDASEGKKKRDPEAKAERDYKRLKSYTDKKAVS